MTRTRRAVRKGWVFALIGVLGAVACNGDEPTTEWRGMSRLFQAGPDPEPGPERRMIVVARPGRLGAVRASLQAAGAKVHHEFADLNAVAATLPASAADGLQRNPSVEYAEEDPPRYPLSQTQPYGVGLVQAPAAWGTATGDGVKVCIIDSGINPAHEDFLSGNITGENLTTAGVWNKDGCGHGTHVAGTIAAVNNGLGVVGVAPAAKLHILRVFGDSCGWISGSDLIAAARRCADAGARIINMSLGGSLKSRTEEQAFSDLNDKRGMLSVAAAGNDGSNRKSYPASYPSVVSVAALDQDKTVASFSQKNDEVDLAAPGVGVLSTVPWLNARVVVDGVVYRGVPIENAALSAGTDGALVSGGLCKTTSTAWAGKVVLCERGEISFNDKVKNVQASGGRAAVIYNNAPGGFSGTLGSGNTSTIPAIALSQEDGQALVAGKLGANATVITSVDKSVPGSGYEAWDGTSMATPHVAAVAALVWSAHPTATNTKVREALERTAEDLGALGRDNAYGHGLVRARAAIDHLGTPPPPAEDPPAEDPPAEDPPAEDPPPADTTPPVISDVASAKTNGGGGFRITWKTDEPASSSVTITGHGTFNSSTPTTNHSMAFNGKKGVRYEYFVSSTDAAGNKSTSGPHYHQN